MKELLLPFGIMVAWFVFSAWVLPMFGVNTCLSGSCARYSDSETKTNEKHEVHGRSDIE